MKTKILIWILAVFLLSGSVMGSLTDNVLASWSFEESNSSLYLDSSGNNKDLTRLNSWNEPGGIIGKQVYINGTIWGFNATNLQIINNFSTTFWVNGTYSGGSHRVIYAQQRDCVGSQSYYVSITNGGFYFQDSDDTAHTCLVGTLTNNVRYFVTAWHNGTGQYVRVNNGTPTNCDATFTIGTITCANSRFSTYSTSPIYIDELNVWNRSISINESDTMYNGGLGKQLFSTTGNFTVTGIDEWNLSSLNVSVWVDEIFKYTNTTVTTNLYNNDTSLHNITIGATNYFNKTYYNYNVSSNLVGSLHQAEVCFNSSSKISNETITVNNYTINSNSSNSCFNISSGTYNVTAKKTGWFDKTQEFVIVPLQNNTQTVINMSYANLTISAKDGTTNASITNCSSSIKSLNFTSWVGESQTTSLSHYYYLINGTYNVSVVCQGYALDYSIANVSVIGNTNYTFILYKVNSVTINILDELTGLPISDDITVRWSSEFSSWENVTNNSGFFIYNLTATNYTLLFYGSNYSTRSYVISVGESSTQFLTAYMIASTYSTILTIKDQDTTDVLKDISVTMYKLIGSTWSVVESKVTDITGKAQFYYDPIASYKFFLSGSVYDDYVFYLTPILFGEYDVFMQKSSVLDYAVDFDKISIIYSPSSFNNDQNTTFNWLISNPTGELTSYSIRLTFPGGVKSVSGNNAIGEQLSTIINISGANSFDVVVLDYNYTSAISGLRSFRTTLPINVNATGNLWTKNKDVTYGLGIFERMLIATIIVIFVVGITTIVGQAIPGLFLGLFVFGFLSFIGFIPLWGILPSMLIGVIFLIWKSGGY